ncbi:hypothetical protein FB45DRAFT_1065956 [Roridomyces roridus]|uniref:Uncharacterized protein n=1 Tax=Roridomyces roridus TaxID=1738132 RepID=A0AAD7FC58_9AGAR|nr:hypothetical protein FB45DRAFT_1065956 [Roridomyces roridus]
MIFPTTFFFLTLSLFAGAKPLPADVAVRDTTATDLAVRDTVPNTSVVPLTLFEVFQVLQEAVVALTPGLESIAASMGPEGQAGAVAPLIESLVEDLNTATASLASLTPGDMGAADADLAKLVENVLDDVNIALNKLIPQLGLDGVLAPVDGALSGLLTGLNGIVPGVLALVGAVLIPVGGLVGSLLANLGLAGL